MHSLTALKRAVFLYSILSNLRKVMRLTGKMKPVMEVRACASEVCASHVADGSGVLYVALIVGVSSVRK